MYLHIFAILFLAGSYIEVLTDVILKKIVQMIKNNENIIVAVAAIPLVCLVHPAIGLGVLLISHALHAHSTLCRYILPSFLKKISEMYHSNTFSLPDFTVKDKEHFMRCTA